jgi:hypothetical protein
MKKIVTVAAVALFAALVLPSCKKDYVCTCSIQGQTTTSPMNDTKKSDAKAACDALNATASMVGGSCSLD